MSMGECFESSAIMGTPSHRDSEISGACRRCDAASDTCAANASERMNE